MDYFFFFFPRMYFPRGNLFVFLASVTKTSVDEFDKQVQEKRVTTTWINNRNKQSVYYLINVRFQTHLIEQRMNPVSIGRSFFIIGLAYQGKDIVFRIHSL